MKDLSLFLLKNSFGLKMKKGFKNLCNGESSTSILDPQKVESTTGNSSSQTQRQPTLEEMIMQLEMEEKMGRKGKVDGMIPHRMSCVSSCDILRSARNALNQYPRFSLDGKDAMYRSSFRNYELEMERRLPSVVGGESVIWRKPGVVGRLMGLDAMPVPLNASYRRERLRAIITERRRDGGGGRRRGAAGSCSRAGYCVVGPVELEMPKRRFV